MTDIHGIAGLVGREPIAAALSAGIKSRNGAPVEKDRFHIQRPDVTMGEFSKRDGGKYNSVMRELHPSFAAFNNAAPDRRQSVPATIAHATPRECFTYRWQAVKLPGIAHPKNIPVCRGDGVRAERWDPKTDQWCPMACPGDKCPYTQKPSPDKKAPCGPWMLFVARFDWPRVDGKGLPNLTFKYSSGGWNTIKTFVGLFDGFVRSCEGLGVDPSSVPLFGLPVVLQLQERTDPGARRRFPVVSISVSGDRDIIDWILWQRGRIKELGPPMPVAAITDLTDTNDYDLISGPQGVPGA